MTSGSSPTGARAASLIADVLALDLVELAAELARGAIDLPEAATMVQRDFKLAVRSLLALTLTVGLDVGPPVTLTLAPAPVAARDVDCAFSLYLDSDPAAKIVLTCYAGQPEVFDELARDLAVSLRLPPSAVDLDPPLPTSPLVPGLQGLDEFRTAHEDSGQRHSAR